MSIATVKKVIKKTGLSTDMVLTPYYLMPYNFSNGYAFPPIRVVFEVTFRCNLTCQMCPLANWKSDNNNQKSAQLSKEELSTPEIKSFVDGLRRLNTKAIMITGGEPFLRKDILEILSYVKDKGLYCTIISNGTLINDEIAENLADIGNDVISFSLDGPKDIHNKIRGCGDSFTRIYNTIEKIQGFKKGRLNPKINLNFTISALNQGHIDEIVDIAHKLKINMVNFLYLFYTSEDMLNATSKVLEMGRLKPEDQDVSDNVKHIDTSILKASIERAKQKAKRYAVTLNFRPPLKGDEIERRFYNPVFSYCSRCFYPWFETRLDPHGNIYPCSIDIPMGNIREDSVQNIWNNKQYRDFRKTLKKHKLLPACAKCCKLNNKFWSYLPCI